jgi:hypothetical protein
MVQRLKLEVARMMVLQSFAILQFRMETLSQAIEEMGQGLKLEVARTMKISSQTVHQEVQAER